ncbi:MAG TPA: TraR/DksA C4-type zinc finger protein [Micromonosporaceae bacterium]|nr:TraR/DksA C4-type zinc finger protein [Micromonosporaceae bacterium]
MTVAEHRQFEALHRALEEQFALQTAQLAALTQDGDGRERDGYDLDTHNALVASARQALAETTAALQRLADGTYGRCERCQADIPLERLEILPHARHCVPCQSKVAA